MTESPLRPPTILDVAREAGVSKSTVSRVLDERLPTSHSASAQRVRDAAQRLGYRRDRFASALRRQQTRTVGVLVPRLTDTVMAMTFEQVAAACARRDQFAIVATTDDDPATEQEAVERLLDQRVDGLVLTTARLGDDLTARLRDRGVPVVLALRADGSTPSAVGDDELGGYLAARHLVDLGHRRIALVAGPSYASSAVGRQAGFRRALAEVGVTDVGDLVHESAFSMESGEDVARRVLASPDRPTAVFAVNDNTAIGVLAAAQALELSVPEDVSVVGYNDVPVSARLPRPLTTVRVPFDQIAAATLELLDETRAGAPVRHVVVAPTLIPRSTSARPPS
ncbi:MAG: LacI family DNA-binding transcriptional regulator [Propionibacteriales bacterium]|nr:LacI family DNA-binding transcriptional regulator [Propionibacteriales bacterium]